jgi:MoaA/NifB/PqqE/SkfB family radical SAM enzyme
METREGPVHATRFEDIAVTVDFHCNSACRFCIVQEGMNRYKGLPFDRYESLVRENVRSGKYHRVIFTGGEVTLEPRLFDFVRLARESGAFEFLRVQTNGRRLADAEFARRLVSEGVNEFFVSVHGHDPVTHDDITQRPGSFEELVRGLENVRALGARVITNTVLTARNLGSAEPLVALAARHGAARMEFWNYLPMEDQIDDRNLIAPLVELVPAVVRALDACRVAGMPAVVKYLPRCLLGEHQAALDNSQADVIIVEEFWTNFPRFNCLYEAVCEHSDTCLGVHHAYVNKWGWEADLLAPTPRTRPWTERAEGAVGPTERDGHAPSQPIGAAGHGAWAALVEGAAAAGSATLERVQLTRNQARFRYVLAGGGAIDVVLGGRDEKSPALARTRSFNVFYANAEGIDDAAGRERVLALVSSVVDAVRARDDGSLTLDGRKGLLQVLPPPRARPRR